MLVCDEVLVGFGRTGEWFGSDLYDVTPDIMTMAKGLTGAYQPLGATIVTDEIDEGVSALDTALSVADDAMDA